MAKKRGKYLDTPQINEIIRLYKTGEYNQYQISKKIGCRSGVVGYWVRKFEGRLKKKEKKVGQQMAKFITEQDKQEILRLYATGDYTQADIGKKTGHTEAVVGYWIRKLRGGRSGKSTAKVIPVANGATNVRITEMRGSGANSSGNPPHIVTGKSQPSVKPEPKQTKSSKQSKPVKVKDDYQLCEREKNLTPEVIKLLETSATHDDFSKGYLKEMGFEDSPPIHALINMFTHRAAILKFEKEKQETAIRLEKEKKEAALRLEKEKHEAKTMNHKLLIDRASKIIERADEEVGSTPSLETLVTRTNQFLAENIQLHKEMLALAKKQYALFEEIRAHKAVGKTTTYTPADEQTVFPHEQAVVAPQG